MQTLTRISYYQYIDLKDIYLTDYDDYAQELMIYINQHAKHPVILKDVDDINKFIVILENYRTNYRNQHEQSHAATENVESSSKDTMELVNASTESAIQ